MDTGHLQLKEGLFEEVTFGSITQCTEGDSKIKTGKNFRAGGTVGCVTPEVAMSLECSKRRRRAVWLKGGKERREKDVGLEIKPGTVSSRAS